MIADSAFTDPELSGWLRKAEEQGNNFLRPIAEAAFLADSQTYAVLRSLLLKLKLKEDESRSATSSTVLDR